MLFKKAMISQQKKKDQSFIKDQNIQFDIADIQESKEKYPLGDNIGSNLHNERGG